MSFPIIKGRPQEGDGQAVQQEGERHSRKWVKRWRGIELALELRSRKVTRTVRKSSPTVAKVEALRLAPAADALVADPDAAPAANSETTTTSTTYAVALCVTPPDTGTGPQ